MGAVGADLEGVQRQARVVDRARRRGEVVDEVDRVVEEERLGDVAVQRDEARVVDVLDVLQRPRVEVVDADHAVALRPAGGRRDASPESPPLRVTTQVAARSRSQGRSRIAAPTPAAFATGARLNAACPGRRRAGRGCGASGSRRSDAQPPRPRGRRPPGIERRGAAAASSPVLALRRRRRGRSPALDRDPADQGRRGRPARLRRLDAGRRPPRGARRPPHPRAQHPRRPARAGRVRSPGPPGAARAARAGDQRRRGCSPASSPTSAARSASRLRATPTPRSRRSPAGATRR